MDAQRLSVVVPALNEAPGIRAALEALAPLRARGHEVVVVDGGSDDGTARLAGGLCDRILSAKKGRAVQMNAGAGVATGDVLLFLHADTRLPPQFVRFGVPPIPDWRSASAWRTALRRSPSWRCPPMRAWSWSGRAAGARSRACSSARSATPSFMMRPAQWRLSESRPYLYAGLLVA